MTDSPIYQELLAQQRENNRLLVQIHESLSNKPNRQELLDHEKKDDHRFSQLERRLYLLLGGLGSLIGGLQWLVG